MTWLKFNESTRNLAGVKSVSDRRVQYYGLKSRACRSLTSWCARCIELKVIKCHRGCKLEEHRSKVSKGDGLERCTSNIVDGIGRLRQRLILQLHDHK